MAIYQIFIYLQLLDVLTTLAGLRLGASEASPFVRLLMGVGPISGLALSKVLALSLGGVCIYLKRQRILRWASYWYSGLIVWNLIMILAACGHVAA